MGWGAGRSPLQGDCTDEVLGLRSPVALPHRLPQPVLAMVIECVGSGGPAGMPHRGGHAWPSISKCGSPTVSNASIPLDRDRPLSKHEAKAMKNWIVAALLAVVASGGALGATASAQETTANVEVTVWQRISDGSLYLSTRPEGGRWTTHNTALDMRATSRSGNLRQGSAITVGVPVTVEGSEPSAAQETTASVEVTVWQRISDGSLYLSTRPEGGTWTTHNTALDMSNVSRSGRFRQGSAIQVAVPVTIDAPEEYQPVIASNWWDNLTAKLRYHARESEFFIGRIRTDVRIHGENEVLELDAVCFASGNAAFGFLLMTRDSHEVEVGTELVLNWRLNDEPFREVRVEVTLLGEAPALYFYSSLGFSEDWPNMMDGGVLSVRTELGGVLEDLIDLDSFRQTPVHGNLVNCGTY